MTSDDADPRMKEPLPAANPNAPHHPSDGEPPTVRIIADEAAHTPSPTPDDTGDGRNPVEYLAEAFIERIRHQDHSGWEELAHEHPEMDGEIRDLFPTIEALERMRARRVRALVNRSIENRSSDRFQPDRLGDFRILREIGRGGMGVVLEAEQESLGRVVAVKVLPRSSLMSATQLARFQREARTAAQLHHTNIVPVFGVGECDGTHFYVMQRIDGSGLDVRIRRDTPPRGEEIESLVRLGLQAALALQYAHERGVLHRDIKPSNLLLDRSGTLWVADFGLAKALESDGVSASAEIVGTLRYMAPEQFRGKADARSDIYSLGLTMYEMLTGQAAFQAEERREQLQRGAGPAALRPPRRINPEIPRDLETIILKASAELPDDRYATAGALAEDLRRFLEDRPIAARRTGLVERLWRWARRNPAIAGLTAVIVGLLASISLLSTTGYWQMRSILVNEAIARASAESSARTASDALDKIFHRFAAAGADPQNALLVGGGATPALSDETATLLQELLEYYDQLASRYHHDTRFLKNAAEARKQMGDIHVQLGRYEPAIAAYRQAIEASQRFATHSPAESQADSWRIFVARVHNGIGIAHRFRDESEASAAAHRTALAVLGSAADSAAIPDFAQASPAVRCEAARTYYLLGCRVRPGMGPFAMPPSAAALDRDRPIPLHPPEVRDMPPPPEPAESLAHLESARQMLERLVEEDTKEPTYQLLLAACLREWVPDSLSRQSPEQRRADQRAIDLLTRLVDDYPEIPLYRHHLVQTYAEFTIFNQVFSPEDSLRAEERLRKAIEHSETLIEQHPNLPEYLHSVIHAHFKLGNLLEQRVLEQRAVGAAVANETLLDDVERSFRKAMNQQAFLVKRFADAPAYAAWLALFQQRLGDFLRRRQRYDESHYFLARSVRGWTAVSEGHSDLDVSVSVAAAYDSLAQTLAAKGETELAGDARRASRDWADLRPPPRGDERPPRPAGKWKRFRPPPPFQSSAGLP